MPDSSYDDFIESLNRGASASEYSVAPSTKRISESISTQKTKKQSVDKTVELGITDVQRIEHSYQIIKKNLRTLLDECPDQRQLNKIVVSDAIDDETKQAMLLNKSVWLASSLKSMYLDGEIPVVDSILADGLSYSPKLAGETKAPNGTKRIAVPTDDENNQVEGIPPLPTIKDPELAARVFVHKSTTNSKSYLAMSELINSHNERIEF